MSQNAAASTPVVPPSSGPSASNPTTAAGAVSANVNLAQASSSSSTISSLSDLRRKSPKIYNFMMLSIAQNMCIQMGRENDRLIEEMKKMKDDSQS